MAKKYKVVAHPQKDGSPKKNTNKESKQTKPQASPMDSKSFAEMMEQSMGQMKDYEPGEEVEAEILAISGESIFLQLNGKSEGVLSLSEMTDKEGNVSVKEGDRITAFFLKAQRGELHFTTRISSNEAGVAVLDNAYKKGIPVEGVVEKEIKGGFEIKVGESRAFCPYSQMGEKRVEDPKIYLGKHLSFKIMERSEGGRNIIVSNREVLQAEKEKQVAKQRETLKEGMTCQATVVSIRDFGAFVNVNGLQALLPISEISRTRVDDIQAVLSEGDEVTVQVLKLDWANNKFSVSMKALIPDPWDKAQSHYQPGGKYPGTVARITDFGAFVTLEPGLDGLIHVSDLKSDSRDASPADIVKQGESINVVINSIDYEKKRISLKPVSSVEEDEVFQKYMEPEAETYNPFAALLKDKVKKK